MKIYPQCCPGGSTERCKYTEKKVSFSIDVFRCCLGISMRGNKDDVISCLTEVYTVLEGVPPRGPFRYYDPSNYNGYNVTDYGGFMDNQQHLRGNNS